MMKRLSLLFTILIMLPSLSKAQIPQRPTSAEIFEAIQKLQFLGSALYIAAHPDDENTRLISWLANDKKAEVAYLSLTRGDGGQNLIGTEIQELLGVLRTQELLAARRLDGGNQFFSRANDFGYSKTPQETLEFWNEKEVLGDVVWTIRKWQPDVIINRFDHTTPGSTHGHHTASAMLSVEAFDLAGDEKAYPNQLEYLDTWQPTRLFFNTSWWFYGSREKFANADKSNLVAIDVGTYYPLKGKSNTEIAAESRSQHRCQGMGRISSRGSQMEYLKFLKGEKPDRSESLFEGINTTWSRVAGGTGIGNDLAEIEHNFDFTQPWHSVPELVAVYSKIKALPKGHWRNVKLEEIKSVIKNCLGLFTEATAASWSAIPGAKANLNMEIILRAPAKVQFASIAFLPTGADTVFNILLSENEGVEFEKQIAIPENINYTNPYWLEQPWEPGMYTVEHQQLIGLPETPRPVKAIWNLIIEGHPISYTTDVVYKSSDPAKGEVYRPFEIIPPAFANFKDKVIVFAHAGPKPVAVTVRAGKDKLTGNLTLNHPPGWRVSPAGFDFELQEKGAEETFVFTLTPPDRQSEGIITPNVRVGHRSYHREIVTIAYDHIPTQTIMRQSEAKVVKVDLKKAGSKIGYLMGAGDEIPASLEQIGYTVSLLDMKDLNLENLKKYDAVILGVRAYNTEERLKFAQPALWEYVADGGTLITQYNTTWRLKTESVAPLPLQLSRDRVTVESAPVRFLAPAHPVLNFPNKITKADFDGWVQERGLYFPDEWDDDYTAVLSSNDPGEAPKDGGLLVAKYGDGYFIYTGYSWFRELPAGVPGAYRIFTNLISIGKKETKP